MALLAVITGCTPAPPAALPGVVEADAVYLAPAAAGRLAELTVARGDTVRAGTLLFRVEAPDDAAALAEAQARAAQQAAQAADLATGRRPDELAVAAAQLVQARSALVDAQAQWRRERELANAGFVSGSRLDTLAAARDGAAARVAELQAQQRVARLAGRDEARRAAAAALQASEAQVRQLQARLADKAVRAPRDGRVDDTLFRPGEWVGAGTPVVRLLPPDALKVRFFVEAAALPRVQVGDAVRVRCEGCPAPLQARVRFIAGSAEFTPPVIYSRDQRARLVYLVEAAPAPADAAVLRVGQPVDVTLPEAAR